MARTKGDDEPKVQKGVRLSVEMAARLVALAKLEKRTPADVQRLLIEFGLYAHDRFRIDPAKMPEHLDALMKKAGARTLADRGGSKS